MYQPRCQWEIESHSKASQAEAFGKGLAAEVRARCSQGQGDPERLSESWSRGQGISWGVLAPRQQSLHLVFAERTDFAGERTSLLVVETLAGQTKKAGSCSNKERQRNQQDLIPMPWRLDGSPAPRSHLGVEGLQGTTYV